MNIFLTGYRQIGKSTAINMILERLFIDNPNMRIGGYRTFAAGEKILISEFTKPDSKPKKSFVVGIRKKEGYPEVFDESGVEILKHSAGADIIVMDEIGWMESSAKLFSEEILRILDTKTPVLGVIRKGCRSPLIESILQRPDITLIEVNKNNRDLIPANTELLNNLHRTDICFPSTDRKY